MRTLFMLLSLAMCLAAAHAADISSNPPWIDLTGEIVAGDEQKFEKVTSTVDSGVARLNISGGDIPTAIAIAKMVHDKEYSTLVTRDRKCAAVCPLIWISGQHSIIQYNAELQFYVPTDEKGIKLVIDYYHSLGFGWEMVDAGPLFNNEIVKSSVINFWVRDPPGRQVGATSTFEQLVGFENNVTELPSISLGSILCPSKICVVDALY